MATSLEYIEFVCRQLEGVGILRYRKMFGDYFVYVNEKPMVLCCDDICYIKIIPELEELMAGAERGRPFPGANEWYLLDIEHCTFARRAVSILEEHTPFPKDKKKTKKLR